MEVFWVKVLCLFALFRPFSYMDFVAFYSTSLSYYISMQFLVGCKLHVLVVCAMTMKLDLIQSNG